MSSWSVLLSAALCILLLIPGACLAIPGVGTSAPNFTLPMSSGGTLTLSTYWTAQPKIVLLDFWTSWCGPCTNEIPYLIQIADDYRNRGVVVVGVTGDFPLSDGYNWATSHGVNYTICGDAGFTVTATPYQIAAIPSTFIIDGTGMIQLARVGFGGNVNELRSKLDQLTVPEPSSVVGLLMGLIGVGAASLRRRHS